MVCPIEQSALTLQPKPCDDIRPGYQTPSPVSLAGKGLDASLGRLKVLVMAVLNLHINILTKLLQLTGYAAGGKGRGGREGTLPQATPWEDGKSNAASRHLISHLP